MQIIINIDKDLYTRLFDNGENYVADMRRACVAIRKGVPLSEGHGKIVDIGKIDKDKIESNNPIISLMIGDEYIEAVSLDYLNDLPPIVEADAENENK